MTVWWGYVEFEGDSKSHSVAQFSREYCETEIRKLIAANPGKRVDDAWLHTQAMSSLERDAEPAGVMTMRKLRAFKKALGRDDVVITVGGVLFQE